jgi:hypothetical protein
MPQAMRGVATVYSRGSERNVRKLNLSNTENGDVKIQHFCGLSSLAFGEVF